MKKKLNYKDRGFTIIEVLIVLAIAALILLIVFLAVPALQRSQRNNARKSDAGRISASVVEWSSSHNNALPNECVNWPASFGTMAQFSGLTCATSATVVTAPAVNTLTVVTAVPAAGTLTNPPNAGNIVEFIPGVQCIASALNNGYSVGSLRNAALFYTTESGSTWSWNCLNPQ